MDYTSWNDNYVYEFVDKRIEYLDQYFEKLYRASLGEAIYVYDGVDYTNEFNAWYYWYRYWGELYEPMNETFNEEALLEHFALYGKPNGWIARDR